MKRDWRNTSVDTCTSAGRLVCRSCKASSNFPVSSIVPVFGCLVTVSNTAGLPFSEARPSLGCWLPVLTSAMSYNVTGEPPAVLMTARPIFRTSSVETTPRTMYSLPYW